MSNGLAEDTPAKAAPQISLQLDLNGVLAPAQAAIVLSTEVVDFMLDAMSHADL